jgi:hypothetical protein
MLNNIKIEVKNKLYFNKFKYKAMCTIQGAAYTYYTPDLHTFIIRMEKFKDNKLRYGIRVIEDDWKEYWDEVNLDQVSQFLTWRNTVSKDKCMLRIQGDTVSFFSNDISLLDTLKSIDKNVSYFEAEVYKADTIYFSKNPKFKYRTFFKGKRCPDDFFSNIIEFCNRYPKANVSRGLQALAHNRRKNYTRFIYLHSSYYVDYNDESMISILHMLFPNMVGKTYSLAKRP